MYKPFKDLDNALTLCILERSRRANKTNKQQKKLRNQYVKAQTKQRIRIGNMLRTKHK